MGVEWKPWGQKEERKGKRGNSQALSLALPFQSWEEWSGIEPSLAARGTPKRGQITEEQEEGRGWKAWKQKVNKGESGKKIDIHMVSALTMTKLCKDPGTPAFMISMADLILSQATAANTLDSIPV